MVWAWMHWPMDGLAGLGMDALVNGWAGSMDVSTVWVWMHWPRDGLVAWALPWFERECTGQWMGW